MQKKNSNTSNINLHDFSKHKNLKNRQYWSKIEALATSPNYQ